MLPAFRRFVQSKFGAAFALLFLGLIALAFVLGDVTGSGGLGALGGGGGSAAKAGGAKLSQAELESRIQRAFESTRRDNPGLTSAAFFEQGGATAVFDELVSALALGEFAKDEGVHISKRLIDAEIARIPAFQDASGNFNEQTFRSLLARERISEQSLRDDITRQLLARQMVLPATLGPKLPDSLVLPYASLLLEARQGTIAAIPAAAFADIKDPTDAQLAEYYKANADRFTIPEQRRIRYAVIDLARFAQAAAPTAAEIAAYYNQNKARYAASETRTVEQLVLPTQAGAKAIADQVKGGKSLAEAAKGAGLAVATLKDQSRAALAAQSSDAVASAAFGAAQGALAGPVRGSLGWVLVKVVAVNTVPARSLAQATPEIAATLKEQKEKALLADFTGKIEDQIAEGGTFEEVVKDNGLKLETTAPVVATGQNVDDSAYVLPDDVKPLLQPVFAMGADDDAQMIPIVPDKRYALAAPGDIIAAAPPPLAKVKAAILVQYKLNQGNQKAKALAEQIRAKVAKGAKLADAIAQAGVKLPAPQTVGGRRAELMQGQRQLPPPLAMMFSMATGSVKTLPMGQDRGYFVIRLDGVKAGDAGAQPALVNQVREQLAPVTGEEYGRQFQRAVAAYVGTTRDAGAVARAQKALSANPVGE